MAEGHSRKTEDIGKVCSLLGVVAVGLLLLPVAQSPFPGVEGGEAGHMKVMTLTPNESNIKDLYCKRVRFFFFLMQLGKLSCHSKVFGWSLWNWRSLLECYGWLGLCVISHRAFGLRTGCFGQFCLLIVGLQVLAFACMCYCPAWVWY